MEIWRKNMASLNIKILCTLLIFLNVSISTQNTIVANYTSQLLRQAKTAELLAYQSNDDYVCSNFHEQACGNWKKSYPATSHSPKTSHLGQIHNLYVSKCRDVLKSYQGLDASHEFVSKFYASCINKPQIEKMGVAPILDHLHFKGGWPHITNLQWYEFEYDWLKVVADIRRELNLNLFIGLELNPEMGFYTNIKNIQISAPKLPLVSKVHYLDPTFVDERTYYKNKIAERLQKYFSNVTTTWCEEVAEQVLSVEISLARGLPDNEKKETAPRLNVQTVAQLKAKYATNVDFSRYLTLVFDRTVNEPIYELSSDYFSNLFQTIEHTPKLTIANYTMWRVLDHLGFIADHEGTDREIWCAEKVIKHFPHQVASLYANEFKAKAGDKTGILINRIFSDIKKALEIKFGKVENFAWMSQQTRQKANEHFGRIAFPATDADSSIDEILHKIHNDRYYENLLQILQLETKKELQTNINDRLYRSRDETPTNVPHYSSKHNEIIVPIEFMQTHFLFDPEYPNAINYGTIGVLLAQQLLRGLLYEESTKKWWDNATEVAFNARQECFAKQLGNYKFNGKSVEDKDGVSKFLINTGAVELAFDAYAAWLKQDGIDRATESLSSHLSYADERLFFLSFGQMYCADYYLLSFNRLNELPERLLVNGALVNFAKFGELFKCTINSKMNPKNKCTIF